MKTLMRAVIAASSVLCLLHSGHAAAQAWPVRSVSMLVGFPAGSGIDLFARLLAEGLRERTGQSVIVENRPGAASNLAAQAVARAAPDGYTVLYAANALSANVHLFRSVGYDPVKDFSPVTTFLENGWMLLAYPGLQVNSVSELTAYLKARPGKLAYGTSGASGLIAAELYRFMAGFDAVNVPYKGVPPAVTDLLAGRTVFMFADISTGLSLARSGKAKGLAVTNPRRVALAPEIPSMAESGLSGYELVSWQAVLLPAGAPREVVNRLAELTNAVGASERAQQFFTKMSVEGKAGSPEALARLLESEIQRWGQVIKAAGIAPE